MRIPFKWEFSKCSAPQTFRPAPEHRSVTGCKEDKSSEAPGHASARGSEVDQLCLCPDEPWLDLVGLGRAQEQAKSQGGHVLGDVLGPYKCRGSREVTHTN